MWHLIDKSKQKIAKPEKGFITLEILIALLIALGFVAVSMQSLVYAMAIKVQAQEKQRANQLIQEDIERINQLGSDTTLAGTCDAANYAAGYASNLWTALQATANADNLATTVTTSLLKSLQPDGIENNAGKTLGLRRFHISVTANNSNAPHRILKIGYQVWDWDGANFTNENGGAITATDEPIAETYVEIIPDVALACP